MSRASGRVEPPRGPGSAAAPEPPVDDSASDHADPPADDSRPGDSDQLGDPADVARAALARARKAARDKGLRPGMRPLPKGRRIGRPAGRSGADRDDRDPALLGDQVARLVDDRGWGGEVSVGSVLGRWAELVGPDVAAHVRAIGFEGTSLTVQADSTAWATQIRLLTSVLLGRIEADVGAGVVTQLHVLGPAAPSWVKGRRRVDGRGPRDTYG